MSRAQKDSFVFISDVCLRRSHADTPSLLSFADGNSGSLHYQENKSGGSGRVTVVPGGGGEVRIYGLPPKKIRQ